MYLINKDSLARYTALSLIWLLPYKAYAQQNEGIAGKLIVCNKTRDEVIADSQNACDFNDLLVVANYLTDVLVVIGLAVTVLVALITGARYLVAGSSDSKKVAKDAFLNLAKGFGLIFGAYLIVNTLFLIAGVDTAFNFLG